MLKRHTHTVGITAQATVEIMKYNWYKILCQLNIKFNKVCSMKCSLSKTLNSVLTVARTTETKHIKENQKTI